jgi:hypothetical protein
MMSKIKLKNDETPEGQKIWQDVTKAAENAPTWTQDHISKITIEKAKVIVAKISFKYESGMIIADKDE